MSTDRNPVVRHRDGEWRVEVGGEEEPFRVLSWRAPWLVLEHRGETQTFFVSRDAAGLWVCGGGHTTLVPGRRRGIERARGGAAGPAAMSSPMPGKVLEILVREGQKVQAGQRLITVEAMKMENPLRATHDGTVKKILVRAGESVAPGAPLIELESST